MRLHPHCWFLGPATATMNLPDQHRLAFAWCHALKTPSHRRRRPITSSLMTTGSSSPTSIRKRRSKMTVRSVQPVIAKGWSMVAAHLPTDHCHELIHQLADAGHLSGLGCHCERRRSRGCGTWNRCERNQPPYSRASFFRWSDGQQFPDLY